MQTGEVPVQLNSLLRIHAIQVYPLRSIQAKDDRPEKQGGSLPLQNPHFAGTQFVSAVGLLTPSWVSQVLIVFN